MTQTNKVALVTGGGAGMGKAICLRLARDGHAVGVLGIDDANIAAAAAAIGEEGGAAIAVQADVANRVQVDAAVVRVRRELGSITILINNAGVEAFCPFTETSEDMWDRLMAVNLKGLYHVTQAVLPDMLAPRSAHPTCRCTRPRRVGSLR
jgi:2-hydroxycyclohexanecarboxyl-CoA dehydrogenase